MLQNLIELPLVRTLIAYAQKYERHVGVGTLIFGFIFDTLTLGGPDNLLGAFVLGAYILASAGCIVALSLYGRNEKVIPIFLLFFLQFCFGNIAGGLLVLYGQSGTLEGSSLFFVVFGAFVLANEFLRQRYALLSFHIGAWFFLTLAYCALVVPILLKQMGDIIFIGSVLIASGGVVLLFVLRGLVSPRGFIGGKKKVVAVLGTIGALFVGLYFLNIIPPVPLSLHQIGIFHFVTRVNVAYEGLFEEPEWYEFFRMTNKVFTAQGGDRAYCFSSIQALVNFKASIFHRWEVYDEKEGEWRTEQTLSF